MRAQAGEDSAVSLGAWRLLAVLTGLNVLNFVVRQLIPSLAPLLMADLGLSRAQIGSLIGFAFVIVYSVVGLALGLVADRWSRRRLVGGGVAIWSAATVASGWARGFAGLAVPRVVCGLGQAALTPAALAMLGDVFPGRRLGLASGIYYAGLPIGTGLSLGLSGWIAPRYGWRACFFAVGLAGFAAVGLLGLVRDPARRATASGAAAAAFGSAGAGGSRESAQASLARLAVDVWRALRDRPALGLLMIGGAASAYGAAAATHGVTWLVQERGFGFASAAWLTGMMAVASGFVGNLAGGWVSDLCRRRWSEGRSYALVLLSIFFAPFNAAFFTLTPGSLAFYACWFLSSASTVAFFGPVLSAIQELAPSHVRAGLVAAGLLVINMVGVGLGSLVTGLLGDHASLTVGLLVSVVVGLAAIAPYMLAARNTRTSA
jgi:MFS family permease